MCPFARIVVIMNRATNKDQGSSHRVLRKVERASHAANGNRFAGLRDTIATVKIRALDPENVVTNPFVFGLRETLLIEAAGLRRALRDKDSLAVESSPEECERMMLAGTREMSLAKVYRDSRRLRYVQAALERMDHGCFGICIECEGPIADRRLAAIPWASRCVRCQESADIKSVSVDNEIADYAV